MNPEERRHWVNMLSWDRDRLRQVVEDREEHPFKRTAARNLLEILTRRRNVEI